MKKTPEERTAHSREYMRKWRQLQRPKYNAYMKAYMKEWRADRKAEKLQVKT